MSRQPEQPDARLESQDEVTVRRGLGFWLAYTVGWLLYSGIIVAATLAEEGSMSRAVATVVAAAVPAALLGAVVAARRRDFFKPDRGWTGMITLHVVTGTFFSVGCALLSRLLMAWIGPVMGMSDEWSEFPFYLLILTYAFLYVLLAGFLMWTEAIARVQESRAAAAREAALRAEAEARAVRAQFNPHFVFNTLHSLMLLVRAEPATAERAIEDVAALIRYAGRLQREGRDAVPLQEEVGFARRYLALEELRLEDRLTVEWDVDESLLGAAVPAFSLQTLLENAVKHGVAPLPEGATILVRVRRWNEHVELAVKDDGQGARPEEVRDSEGRGLELLRQRLDALYGDWATMKWQTSPGTGFQVMLRVPRRGPSPGSSRREKGSESAERVVT